VTACTATPISWLELERHALGELAAARAAGVDEHLAGCPACRDCMDRIRGDRRELPPLVVPAAVPAPRRPWWTRWQLSLGVAGAALAAAVLLLVLLPRGERSGGLALPSPRLRVKGGGDVLIELVRRRGTEVTHEPASYRDGDEFQVLVTCAFAEELRAELVIFDRGQPVFPGGREPLACGNRVTFPAAFRLTGAAREPVVVCLGLGEVDRARVRTVADLPRESTGCIRLSPE
jgi:hypothetical protein